MKSHASHSYLVALLALTAMSGCQSTWKLPGFSGASSAPPPKASKSALFTDDEMAAKPISKAQRADLQMELARSCERKDELDKALHLYEEVIRKAPKRADAYHRMAVVHDKLGQYAKSEPRYRQALAQAPKNAEIHVDMGYSYYLQHRWAEAEKSLKMAVKLSPDMKRAHNNLGLVLARAERYEEARAEFVLAGCTEAESRANLMHAMMLEQRWPQARQECQAALASRTVSPAMRQRLGKVDQMLASRCNGNSTAAAPAAQTAPAATAQAALQIPAPEQPAPAQYPVPQTYIAADQPGAAQLPEAQPAPEQQYTLVADVRPETPAIESPLPQQTSTGIAATQISPPAPRYEPASSIALIPQNGDPAPPHDGATEARTPTAPTGEVSFGTLRVLGEDASTPQQ